MERGIERERWKHKGKAEHTRKGCFTAGVRRARKMTREKQLLVRQTHLVEIRQYSLPASIANA